MADSLDIQAITALAPRKFHQIFTTPATESHGPLKTSFSIAGIEHGENVPTILFCGGMFGTRWQAHSFDWMATRDGVRVIFIDRPGFGASTPVEISQRIPTFLEVIPLLLLHLGIKHISIAAQSAGTIYGLNLLARRPDLLSPSNPRVSFFSPWVHQSHSSVSMLKLASLLPDGLLNHWNKLTGFVINNAQPAFAVSGGAITAVSDAFHSKAASREDEEEMARKSFQGYGIPLDLKDEMDKLTFKFAFRENTRGANDEARMCLKSIPGTSYAACEDYELCVSCLAAVWAKNVKEGGPKLRISVILPEDDALVGEKGMKYFENCWAKEKCGDGIEVEITKLEGTDHDTTASPTEGAVGRMFAEVKGLLSQ